MLDALDSHLCASGGDYLVGTYSLADVSFTPMLAILEPCGLAPELAARPALSEWVGRCLARPA